MKTRYEWRILTDDGLLKYPQETDGMTVNRFWDSKYQKHNNYGTESEAELGLQEWYNLDKDWNPEREYTLIKLVTAIGQ